jgi:hypothetical protein
VTASPPLETPTVAQPTTCLPAWGAADLPEPEPVSLRHWTRFVGPGVVMMGMQLGGGEWLMGPEVTARYGGGLLWIATIAIVVQVFYNLEVGRYALYCGEPIFTGFLRLKPGPRFWVVFFLVLSAGMVMPGLATHGGAVLTTMVLGRPPGEADRAVVMAFSYFCLGLVVVPTFFGGRVYNSLQAVMSVKVAVVLVYCLAVGLLLVAPANWWNVFSGFARFGTVPVSDGRGGERAVNVLGELLRHGRWPAVSLANIALLGAFAGYAGGGLGNSLYANYVRDKGWGMGRHVGAIPSAIGGKHITLSHIGKAFPITAANLRRWSGWWRVILADQLLIWAPGCFVGMALPALLSLQFAPHSTFYRHPEGLKWAQAVITADGISHAPGLGPGAACVLGFTTLLVGLVVLLPSQMSVVDEVGRRWTDTIWSASPRVRSTWQHGQVRRIYYTIVVGYALWCAVSMYLFTAYSTPKLMTLVIANLGNLGLGLTSFLVLHINRTLLPRPLRPRWWQQLGLASCGVFYLGLALLVFVTM